MAVDRKWIEEERDGWKKIADTAAKSPASVKEHARTLVAVLDEVLAQRKQNEERELYGG